MQNCFKTPSDLLAIQSHQPFPNFLNVPFDTAAHCARMPLVPTMAIQSLPSGLLFKLVQHVVISNESDGLNPQKDDR